MYPVADCVVFGARGTGFDRDTVKTARIKPRLFYLLIGKCQCVLKTNHLFNVEASPTMAT